MAHLLLDGICQNVYHIKSLMRCWFRKQNWLIVCVLGGKAYLPSPLATNLYIRLYLLHQIITRYGRAQCPIVQHYVMVLVDRLFFGFIYFLFSSLLNSHGGWSDRFLAMYTDIDFELFWNLTRSLGHASFNNRYRCLTHCFMTGVPTNRIFPSLAPNVTS